MYHGDVYRRAPFLADAFKRTALVVVSGAKWNPCGHMLLNVAGPEGWYFHVDDLHGYPRGMGRVGFDRFLREAGKTLLKTLPLIVPRPADALEELNKRLTVHWQWLVIPNNCAHFCEVIVQAGGAKGGLILNCPAGSERWSFVGGTLPRATA